MKRLGSSLIAPLAIALAAGLCVLAAVLGVSQLEARTGKAVTRALTEAGQGWVEVDPDGMLMRLSGTAPDEAARFRALSAAGAVIDAAHVIDAIEVRPANPVSAPQFRVEFLRNDTGISVIGLIPGDSDRDGLVRDLRRLSGPASVTDMVEIADHETPEGWDRALAFGLVALRTLESAKVSVSARRVAIRAISQSPREKAELEQKLTAAAPEGLLLSLDISAPRPVLAPFTLRFKMDADGPRFDACAADTEEAAQRIVAAARRAGMLAVAECPLGLGVPDPAWGEAVVLGIDALARIGGGALTFSDADVTLIAQQGTDPALFDKVAKTLATDLPEVFELHVVLANAVKLDGGVGSTDPGTREFVATLSPEGLVQLRGRVPDALVGGAAESYARARFGQDKVHSSLRLDPNLPEGWPLRVLAGLEALSQLRNGSVVVQSEYIQLAGLTMDDTAQARVARMLSDRLGDAQHFKLDITYREPPETLDGKPTPQACVDRIGGILAEEKITFAPGSTTIEGSAVRVVDRIAEVLRSCPDAEIEIGGHTDSQGREEMNAALSQERAEAVLTALMARRVLTSHLAAKGYGESQPIAGNDSEDGREANRRIEFRLVGGSGADGETVDDRQGATGGGSDGQD